MLSAWSEFRNDHKYGNSHDFGDFLGCKNINVDEISTQYCMVQYFNDLNPPVPVDPKETIYQNIWKDLDISFLGAICLPSSCTIEDVQIILDPLLDEKDLRLGQNVHCKVNLNQKLETFFGFQETYWMNRQRILYD